MNAVPRPRFAVVLMLLGSLSVPWASAAVEGKKPDEPAASGQPEQSKTVIPATSAEIWTRIDAEVAALEQVVASGKLTDVHHHAFAVRDLVAALPERSKSLSADRLAKVQSNVKYVATLAQRLDSAGDANDKAATQAGVGQLKKVIAGIRANY